MTTAKDTGKESGAKASGSKSSESTSRKAETFTSRHAANVAYFKIDAEKRADVKVTRDPKSGLFSIVARGK